METEQLIIIFSIVFVASFINRLSGFAFGMIVMCVLPHILEYTQAVAFFKLMGIILSTYSFIRYRNEIKWPIIFRYLPTLMAANIIGICCAKYNPGINMVRVLGVFFVVYGTFSLFYKKEIHLKNNWKNAFVFSSIGGFLEGFIGTGGPLTVIYLLSIGLMKYEYFATLQIIFGVNGLVDLTVRLINGMVGVVAFKLALICIPIYALAMIIGGLVYSKLKDNKLKEIVYSVITVCGIVNIFVG